MSDPAWGDWIWENRDKISLGLAALYRWLRSDSDIDQGHSPADEKPGILVLGPGGVGKSTLGKILSGRLDPFGGLVGDYLEDVDVQSFPLDDASGVEVLVAPGQQHRRGTWNDELTKLAAGKYRGMILLSAYGYHNHEIGYMASYKDHRLYKGDKDKFLEAFLHDRQNEELAVLQKLSPHVQPPAGGKFWLLTLVTKQDLWWEDRAAAETFYTAGAYAAEIAKIQSHHGEQLFRHELALASLVISNFRTGKGEVLKPNAAGYDQDYHVRSLRNLIGTLEALRRWEVHND